MRGEATAPEPAPAAAEETDAALPWGRSHWDRLPRELQDMVVLRAGPLTQLSAGRISNRDYERMDRRLQQRMWLEAVELEWPGDLARLPRVWVLPGTLWRIRTLAQFERFKQLPWLRRDHLMHAAARRRWVDELDFSKPDWLTKIAAESGSVWLLCELVERRALVKLSPEMAEWASRFGQLDVIKWLHERMPDGEWTPDVLDSAAAFGHLAVVSFLDKHRTEGATVKAMDNAAANGHVDVLAYLHKHRTEGCSEMALYDAAAAGSLASIEYILEQQISEPTSDTYDHEEAVAWLLEHMQGVEWDIEEALEWAHGAAVRHVLEDELQAAE
nr:hypothetical protein HK105_005320 [Polyrhizophydium stewartii]